MSNREQMIRSCRSGLSVLAGVDNRTRTQVAEMRMRDHSAAEQEKEAVMNSVLSERAVASEDYSF